MPRTDFRAKALALALLVSALPAHANDPALIAENFAAADADADGALSLGEFTDFIDLGATQGLGRMAMLRDRGLEARAFGRIDQNADGVVTVEELQALSR